LDRRKQNLRDHSVVRSLGEGAPIDPPLAASSTGFARTPSFIASEFEAMGYRMVIWPVSSPRIANKA